jgi:acetyl/propionyl-CoA carboxylase alpha subunit
LGRALAELRIEGIRTTVPLYRALLGDADFLAGRLDVGMLDRKLASGELRELDAAGSGQLADLPLLAAAIAHHQRARRTTAAGPGAGGAGAATAAATASGAGSGGGCGSAAPAAGSRRQRWAAAGRLDAVRGSAWPWS